MDSQSEDAAPPAPRKAREKPLDIGWLRWVATAIPFAAVGVFVYNHDYLVYAWIAAAAFGTVLCFYFGHILLFRLQCGLFELLAMTAVLGLFEGLMLSTPGVTRIALWLSPLVLAWILYGAVIGLSRARLLEASSTLACMLHMMAAWLGIAWMALAGLAIGIWSMSEHSNMVSPEMRSWCWPLLILGAAGLALDVALGVKAMRRAKVVLTASALARANDSALNGAAVDAKP